MCLKLVAPEFSHKQWNYYKQYTTFLQQEQVEISLFSYKDNRFGCLSRAAGVLLHNLPYLDLFLSLNPHINNKLACLVRELLDLPYLKEYYTVLHSDLAKNADDSFFALVKPVLESESSELFSKLLASYGEVVVEAIRSAAKKFGKLNR